MSEGPIGSWRCSGECEGKGRKGPYWGPVEKSEGTWGILKLSVGDRTGDQLLTGGPEGIRGG